MPPEAAGRGRRDKLGSLPCRTRKRLLNLYSGVGDVVQPPLSVLFQASPQQLSNRDRNVLWKLIPVRLGFQLGSFAGSYLVWVLIQEALGWV